VRAREREWGRERLSESTGKRVGERVRERERASGLERECSERGLREAHRGGAGV